MGVESLGEWVSHSQLRGIGWALMMLVWSVRGREGGGRFKGKA